MEFDLLDSLKMANWITIALMSRIDISINPRLQIHHTNATMPTMVQATIL